LLPHDLFFLSETFKNLSSIDYFCCSLKEYYHVSKKNVNTFLVKNVRTLQIFSLSWKK